MRAIVVAALLALAACGQGTEAPKQEAAQADLSSMVRAGSLTIEGGTARPPLGGQTTGVGYITIRNDGNEADRLIGASSPAAQSIELHTHRTENGVARMEKLEALDVPAHAAVVFAPGGLHLMLFGFKPEGQRIAVTLQFEKAGDVEVPLAIASAAPAQDGGHGSH